MLKQNLIINLIIAALFISCKNNSNISDVKGFQSIIFGGKEVTFPQMNDEKSWVGVNQERRENYGGKKFKIGKRIGEGDGGKIFEIQTNSKVDQNFVVKVFKGVSLCKAECNTEFNFHKTLNDNSIPTTGAAYAQVSRKFYDLNIHVLLKEKVDGQTLGSEFRSGRMKEGADLWLSFVKFKDLLRDGQYKMIKSSSPKFIVDIGELHLENVMYSESDKSFKIVDGDIIGQRDFEQIVNLGREKENRFNRYNQIGNVLARRIKQGLEIRSTYVEMLLNSGTYKKLGFKAPNDSCSMLSGVEGI